MPPPAAQPWAPFCGRKRNQGPRQVVFSCEDQHIGLDNMPITPFPHVSQSLNTSGGKEDEELAKNWKKQREGRGAMGIEKE